MKHLSFMLIFICFKLFSNTTLVEGSNQIDYARILKIARIGNPILRQVAKDVENITSAEIKSIINDMKDTFLDFKGTAVGLAAPQVNISLKIVLIQVPEIEKEGIKAVPLTVMINPSYEPMTNEKKYDYECCLSIPGLIGKVSRYTSIKYSYQDEEGIVISKEAEGYFARVLQHEIDHLNGILYLDKIEDFSTFGFEEEIKATLLQ